MNRTSPKALVIVLISLVLFTVTSPAFAKVGFDFSGFGTIGYASSNQSYAYLKYIDEDGTLYRDSILAGQLDMRINSKFSATVQGQLEADSSDETGVEANIAWAFLSYRPNNDWLVRLGKLRIPGYLNSENADVGVTYDYARIPAEFSYLSPTYDFIGLSVNHSFLLSDGDLSFTIYYGESNLDWRTYLGESETAIYYPSTLKSLGGSVSYQTLDNTYLAALHYAENHNESDSIDWYDSPVFQDLGDGTGYYTYEGANVVDSLDIYLATMSADILLARDIRMAIEIAARIGTGDLINGQNGYSGYISFRKKINRWTPYIFYAQLKTASDELDFHQRLDSSSVPNTVTQAAIINGFQKDLADLYQAFDQYSIALGTSYSLSPTHKIKGEIMLTHIDQTSSFFDAPTEINISNQDVAVFSLSYSFVF